MLDIYSKMKKSSQNRFFKNQKSAQIAEQDKTYTNKYFISSSQSYDSKFHLLKNK